MRNIVNISLPPVLAKAVEKEVKAGNFASKSEFFRHLFRQYQLANELEADRRVFERGSGKKLTSLTDLR